MPSGTWTEYHQFKRKLGLKVIDLTSDTIKCALFTSSSNCSTSSLSSAVYSTLTNEVAAGNGYSTGGVTVTATWTNSSGTQTFDVSDPTWTPTGSGITARFAVLYDSTTGDLISWTLLDTTPADVSVATLVIDATGAWTLV